MYQFSPLNICSCHIPRDVWFMLNKHYFNTHILHSQNLNQGMSIQFHWSLPFYKVPILKFHFFVKKRVVSSSVSTYLRASPLKVRRHFKTKKWSPCPQRVALSVSHKGLWLREGGGGTRVNDRAPGWPPPAYAHGWPTVCNVPHSYTKYFNKI